ncbi:helix-turn-helix domain-containing protein [Brevibacterium sp. BRM-1]|uniref:helix-turn-helix transcriptional regulator n=1 Tax=Brevibacterium sp. BRM-1 TaxID=2999062 RepID=UPI00227F29A2|nr:helix-turn-helix domain-containing protein [Brevibacterium sp. BRM-1]WAL39570.1 helix-turn-helix domain-containing protein [Brevibacterium sp. BRM-1]
MENDMQVYTTDAVPEWFEADSLSAYIHVPKQTIYRWRTEGKGPRAHKFGRHLRFSRADVEAWINEQADPDPAA